MPANSLTTACSGIAFKLPEMWIVTLMSFGAGALVPVQLWCPTVVDRLLSSSALRAVYRALRARHAGTPGQTMLAPLDGFGAQEMEEGHIGTAEVWCSMVRPTPASRQGHTSANSHQSP